MGYQVHVIRQTDSGEEVGITLDEWNRFIESDADFTPPPAGNINYGKNLFCLPTDSSDPDDWPWIAWMDGRIHSKYDELRVMKKLGQMARTFGAVIMSDDGDLWSIDEEGRVSILNIFGTNTGLTSASALPARASSSRQSDSQPPALTTAPVETIPQPWFLFIKPSDGIISSESRNQLLSEAIDRSLKHYPLSLPIANLEEACSIAERLIELGCNAEVSGYDRTKAEQD